MARTFRPLRLVVPINGADGSADERHMAVNPTTIKSVDFWCMTKDGRHLSRVRTGARDDGTILYAIGSPESITKSWALALAGEDSLGPSEWPDPQPTCTNRPV